LTNGAKILAAIERAHGRKGRSTVLVIGTWDVVLVCFEVAPNLTLWHVALEPLWHDGNNPHEREIVQTLRDTTWLGFDIALRTSVTPLPIDHSYVWLVREIPCPPSTPSAT